MTTDTIDTDIMTADRSLLACTWAEFQQRGKQFTDMAPQAKTEEELHGLWDCIALGYLNLTGATKGELLQAVYLLRLLGRIMIQHEVRLERGYMRA